MLSWWHRDVIVAGKLPLMLCFVSFVVTFVSTACSCRFLPPVGLIGGRPSQPDPPPAGTADG